jgi:hypothetical protein
MVATKELSTGKVSPTMGLMDFYAAGRATVFSMLGLTKIAAPLAVALRGVQVPEGVSRVAGGAGLGAFGGALASIHPKLIPYVGPLMAAGVLGGGLLGYGAHKAAS